MPCKKWTFIAANIIISLFSQSVLAIDNWHPILAFSAGAAFSNPGESKNIPAHDGIFSFYHYDASDSSHARFLGGLFLGAEFLLQPEHLSLQAGLSYYQPVSFTLTGEVTQGADVSSENQYSYQYDIQSQQVLIESKLLYNVQHYHPYLTAGIGAVFNRSQNFEVDIDPPFTTFSNQFKDNTVTSFMYRIGLGIDIDIAKQTRLGLGYRFADLGKTKTGHGVIDTVSTNNTLSQSRLYSNEILAQLTIIVM